MKKLLFAASLLTFLLSGCMQTQTVGRGSDESASKTEKEARKTEEKMQDEILYREARQALENHAFVMEADRVIFKRGRSAFVSSNMNFISLEDDRATVQVAFNGAFPGPNGLGGITVDGTVSNIKMTQDKKGNISFSMNVSGIGVSAQVFIKLTNGTNDAYVTVSPNFNSNRITLTGKLLPIEKSNIFKGRSF